MWRPNVPVFVLARHTSGPLALRRANGQSSATITAGTTPGSIVVRATGTNDSLPRPYRFGYGVLDENQNYQADPGERKLYFEISDFSTQYVFYESPR